MSVGVMKDQNWGIYTSHIHWVTRGTWTPKDIDEVINERFVSVMGECVIFTPQVHRRYSKWSVVSQT